MKERERNSEKSASRLRALGPVVAVTLWRACTCHVNAHTSTCAGLTALFGGVQAQKHVSGLLLTGALLLAAPLAAICLAVPGVQPSLLAGADVAVGHHVRAVAPLAAASIVLCTIDVAAEGILVALHRLRLLCTSMAAVLLTVAAFFAAGLGAGLHSTWCGLLLFFGLRCTVSTTAVLAGLAHRPPPRPAPALM